MDFLQRTPFFRLLLPLIVGIVFYQYIELYVWSQFILIVLSFVFILLDFFIHKSKYQFQFRWLSGCGIFFFLFFVGYFLSEQYDKRITFQNLGKEGVFEVELTENPIEKENSFLCRIKTLQFIEENNPKSSSGKALIYIQKSSLASTLTSGDQLLLRTKFTQPDGALNPFGFDYRTYLKRQGIVGTAYISTENWQKSSANPYFSIMRFSEQMQKKLLAIYKKFGITGDEYAVLSALTLGSKDALNPELRQNYTTSGGMHILAVSGLHVGVIFLVLGFLLSFLNKKPSLKILKTILIVLFLWMYAFITGLPPSVIRSTIMFSMIAIGTGLERKSLIYNTIFASAFGMLLYNPNFLYDVGFQLSYSAVISIVYFQPKISKWFNPKTKALKWAWDLTAVSLAAQIGTAPYALFYFHQFANYFFLTNFVAIPFASFIIYTAVALFILSPVPYISVGVAFVLEWLLRILNYCIQFIHDIPHSLTITTINSFQVFLIFASVFVFMFYIENKKYRYVFGILILINSFFILNLFNNYNTLKARQIIVYSDNSNTHIDFIKGKNHSVFTTDSLALMKTVQSFWINKKLNNPQNISQNELFSNGFFLFQGKRICILTDMFLKNKTTENAFKIDYLIIGNKLKPKIKQILECVSPRKIIVDKSISKWYAEQIKQTCLERKIDFYSVAEHGVYILNITD